MNSAEAKTIKYGQEIYCVFPAELNKCGWYYEKHFVVAVDVKNEFVATRNGMSHPFDCCFISAVDTMKFIFDYK